MDISHRDSCGYSFSFLRLQFDVKKLAEGSRKFTRLPQIEAGSYGWWIVALPKMLR